MENNTTTFKQIHVKVQFIYIYIYKFPCFVHYIYRSCTSNEMLQNNRMQWEYQTLWFHIIVDKCTWCHNSWAAHIIKDELLHIFAIIHSFQFKTSLFCSLAPVLFYHINSSVIILHNGFGSMKILDIKSNCKFYYLIVIGLIKYTYNHSY